MWKCVEIKYKTTTDFKKITSLLHRNWSLTQVGERALIINVVLYVKEDHLEIIYHFPDTSYGSKDKLGQRPRIVTKTEQELAAAVKQMAAKSESEFSWMFRWNNRHFPDLHSKYTSRAHSINPLTYSTHSILSPLTFKIPRRHVHLYSPKSKGIIVSYAMGKKKSDDIRKKQNKSLTLLRGKQKEIMWPHILISNELIYLFLFHVANLLVNHTKNLLHGLTMTSISQVWNGRLDSTVANHRWRHLWGENALNE